MILWRGVLYAVLMCIGKLAVGVPIVIWSLFSPSASGDASAPRAVAPGNTSSAPEPGQAAIRDRLRTSLYPATFIGAAMVSRGEIGLLIAQIARNGSTPASDGTVSDDSGLLSEEGFLVCIWAILLCTLVGPICVGMIIRKNRHRVTAGVWR